MDYNGKRLKRVARVWIEHDRAGEDLLYNKTHPIGFMYQNGTLIEFLDQRKGNGPYQISVESLNNMTSIGSGYYAGDSPRNNNIDDDYVIYRELPNIYDDKTFHWKYNKKHGSYQAVLHSGEFEYLCIFKANGDAVVEIKYVKCDNQHRNRVTIAAINVYGASNQDILDAIQKWKAAFSVDLQSA